MVRRRTNTARPGTARRRKVARQQRVDPIEINCFRHYVQEMKRGAFEVGGGVTNAVAELTGSSAESFEATARRYAALPFARQTLGHRLRALGRFALTPLHPGYDLDRWDRQKSLPVLPRFSLSIDDEDWRATHAGPLSAAWNATSPPSGAVA